MNTFELHTFNRLAQLCCRTHRFRILVERDQARLQHAICATLRRLWCRLWLLLRLCLLLRLRQALCNQPAVSSASKRAIDNGSVRLEIERINGFVQQNRDVLGSVIHAGLEGVVLQGRRQAGCDGVGLVLFDRGGDEAFAAMGLGPDYVKERNASFFTLESHNTYVRELHAGDSVRIETQLLDCDAKRVHYVQQMYHADEGWLSCVTELIVMHVDMGLKKSAPFPPGVMGKITAMHGAHKALPVPPQVGHRIGIPRKG